MTAVGLTLAACGKAPEAGAGTITGGPAAVAVLSAQAETLPVALEYTVQTLGSHEVAVRARVAGILLKRNYTEGSKVRAGQSLFAIDPESFANAVARAEADVAAAEARHAQAARDAARLAPLVED